MNRTYNVIDCETTDMTDNAELLEIASCLVTLDMSRKTVVGEPMAELFKSEGPIAPDARAVHHISPAMVRDRFPATGDDRMRFVHRKDQDAPVSIVVAHNIEYEMRFFKREIGDLPILCTHKAALRVFPEAPSHKNGALYYWLLEREMVPDLGGACQPMHRAGPDTLITAHLLAVLLQNATTQEMLSWTQEHRVLPTCPIGEWKGKPWHDVEHSFLRWMVNKNGMEDELKWNAQREINRRAGRNT